MYAKELSQNGLRHNRGTATWRGDKEDTRWNNWRRQFLFLLTRKLKLKEEAK